MILSECKHYFEENRQARWRLFLFVSKHDTSLSLVGKHLCAVCFYWILFFPPLSLLMTHLPLRLCLVPVCACGRCRNRSHATLLAPVQVLLPLNLLLNFRTYQRVEPFFFFFLRCHSQAVHASEMGIRAESEGVCDASTIGHEALDCTLFKNRLWKYWQAEQRYFPAFEREEMPWPCGQWSWWVLVL